MRDHSPAILTDQKLPTPLRLQDRFDCFAQRAVAAGELCDELRGGANLAASISRRDRQADDLEDGQIGKIIADVRHLFRPEPKLAEQLMDHRQLVFDTLPHQIDAQFRGTNADDLRRAAGDQPKAMARLLPELDPQSIADVKAFALDALVVKDHATISQDAIDVREQEFNSLSKLRKHE